MQSRRTTFCRSALRTQLQKATNLIFIKDAGSYWRPNLAEIFSSPPEQKMNSSSSDAATSLFTDRLWMLTRERRREAGEPQLSHFSSSTGCLFFPFLRPLCTQASSRNMLETFWRSWNQSPCPRWGKFSGWKICSWRRRLFSLFWNDLYADIWQDFLKNRLGRNINACWLGLHWNVIANFSRKNKVQIYVQIFGVNSFR